MGSGALLSLALACPRPALAQVDYRNLDDDRPALIEDAYPIERYAFEFLLSWRYERERGGANVHALVPELSYGLFPNFQAGFKLPLAGHRDTGDRHWGLAGLRFFGLFNFNTEGRHLPALALRTDATFPVGSMSGASATLSVKGVVTRSWGLNRVHLNGAWTFGNEFPLAAAEAANRWWYGVAADHTFFRESTLLVMELYALRPLDSEPVEVNASIGLRRQLTPYLVADLGVARRLRNAAGPDFEVTLGVSRAFAVAGLLGKRR